MGVTIHYTFVQDKRDVKSTLDFVESASRSMLDSHAKALDIPFTVERSGEERLRIDIGECESLVFDFNAWADLDEWSKSVRFFPFKEDRISGDDRITRGFCKTQYAKSVAEHRFVADIIRLIASRCRMVDVYDEGDYYHSGKIDDASSAIEDNGKMIDSLGQVLAGKYGNGHVVKFGETAIKKIKRKKHE